MGRRLDLRLRLDHHLANDQGERKDVSYSHPQRMTAMRQLLAAWEKEMAKHKPEHVVK